VVRYELLWNLRKKKFLGVIIVAIALVTLSLFLPFLLAGVAGEDMGPNPDFALSSIAGVGGLGFFLFGLVIVINSVSTEFEQGTITSLLSKPISRTTVFLGKFTGAFLTLIVVYTVLVVYQVLGGILVYGPQNNLHLTPLFFFGMVVSTLVWMAIALALGSISKSTMITALIAVGVWMGLGITGGVLTYTAHSSLLGYLPGGGASGFIPVEGTTSPFAPDAVTVSTGTDSVGPNLVQYVLHPDAMITFYRAEMVTPGGLPGYEVLYTRSMASVLLQSLTVAFAYILAFSFIAWFALKRT
jgi:ABC-type transport system involved in multi-copper enzyme maturation permease subunit